MEKTSWERAEDLDSAATHIIMFENSRLTGASTNLVGEDVMVMLVQGMLPMPTQTLYVFPYCNVYFCISKLYFCIPKGV